MSHTETQETVESVGVVTERPLPSPRGGRPQFGSAACILAGAGLWAAVCLDLVVPYARALDADHWSFLLLQPVVRTRGDMLALALAACTVLAGLISGAWVLAVQASRKPFSLRPAAACAVALACLVPLLSRFAPTAWMPGVAPLVCGTGFLLWFGLAYELLGGEELCAAAARGAHRYPWQIAGACCIVILALAPRFTMAPTGDEPSYLQYAADLIRFHSLNFTPERVSQINQAFGFPAGMQPHLWPFKDPNPPLHFIGLSISLLPAVSAGLMLGAPLLAARLCIALLFCASLLMALGLSIRITGLRAASLAAALLVFGTLPVIGMSYQVYPETLAAVMVAAFYLLLLPAGSAEQRPVSGARLVGMCCILVALPWLHSKFVLTSATLLVVALMVQRRWKAADLGLAAVVIGLGASAFLGFHLPIFGDMLWKQSDVRWWYPFGMLGQLASSDYGFLIHLPFLILLPLGLRALQTRDNSWRLPLALMLPSIGMLALSGNAANWGSGGDTPLRFYAPFALLWIPALALAIRQLTSTRHSIYVVLLALPAVCATFCYLRDPILAYPPGRQMGRSLMDELFSGVYLRELFPHFPYQYHGVPNPLAQVHALGCIAVFVGLTAVVSSRLRHRLWPVVPMVVTFGALVLMSKACNNPNSTRSATDLYARQVDIFSRIEQAGGPQFARYEGHRRTRLVLPAALRPVEAYTQERVPKDGTNLLFAANTADGRFTGTAGLQLPRGFYRARFAGQIRATSDTQTVLLFRPAQAAPGPYGQIELRQLGANDLVTTATPRWTRVGSEVLFQVGEDRFLVDIGFGRVGPAELLLEKFEIDFVGLNRPDDMLAVAERASTPKK